MKTRSPRSLKNSTGFQTFVVDQLEGLDVIAKSMFGGCGLYCREDFFGTSRKDYERAGMKPFRPYPDRSGTMSYYAVPLAVLESKPDLERWARAAVKVAQSSRVDRRR